MKSLISALMLFLSIGVRVHGVDSGTNSIRSKDPNEYLKTLGQYEKDGKVVENLDELMVALDEHPSPEVKQKVALLLSSVVSEKIRDRLISMIDASRVDTSFKVPLAWNALIAQAKVIDENLLSKLTKDISKYGANNVAVIAGISGKGDAFHAEFRNVFLGLGLNAQTALLDYFSIRLGLEAKRLPIHTCSEEEKSQILTRLVECAKAADRNAYYAAMLLVKCKSSLNAALPVIRKKLKADLADIKSKRQSVHLLGGTIRFLHQELGDKGEYTSPDSEDKMNEIVESWIAKLDEEIKKLDMEKKKSE